MIPRIKIILKKSRPVIVSFALIFFVLFALNNKIDDVISLLKKISLVELLYITAICMLNNIVACLRFLLIARAEFSRNIKFIDGVRVSYAGIFLASWMPLSILGDSARTWWLKNNTACSYSRAIMTVILDRFVALISLVLFMIPFIPEYVPLVSDNWYLITWLVIFTLVICLLFCFYFKETARLLLRECAATFAKQVRHKGVLVQIVVGAAYVLSYFFALLLIVNYLGLSSYITPVELLAYTPVVFLIQNVPIAFGGIGTREIAFMWILGGVVGVPSAVAMSLILGVSFFISTLPGFLFLNLIRRKAT